MEGFPRGIKGFLGALPFMFAHRMMWLFLAPLILWLLFSAGMFKAGGWLTDLLQGMAARYLELPVPEVERSGWGGFWDQVKGGINSTREALLWLVMKLAIFWIVGLIGKYLVLALLSPVLTYASERTEQLLTGRKLPFRWARWLREMARGVLMAVRNGVLEGLITMALWAGTLFLPVLAPVTALLLWLVSSWFYGFSMFDYVFERWGLGIAGSVHAARRERMAVLANGISFNLLMKVPVAGLLTAPLLGAVGATLASVPRAGATGEQGRP